MNLKGTVLGDSFRLVRRLGAGATGEVYRAVVCKDTQSLRKEAPLLKARETVAIKVYKDWVFEDRRQRVRIEREIEFGCSHDCQYLVQIFGYCYDKDADKRFLIMEYIEGETLHDWIRLRYPLHEMSIVGILRQLSEAIDYIHKSGRIHRDVKSRNIMMTTDRTLKLMDFGVLEDLNVPNITESWEFLGTIRNASPEYLLGEKCDHRTDIYSTGTVLYEMLLCKEVFSEIRNKARLSHAVSRADPVSDTDIEFLRKHYTSWIIALTRNLLAKNPDDRIQKVSQIADIFKKRNESSWWLLLTRSGSKFLTGIDTKADFRNRHKFEKELVNRLRNGEDWSGYTISSLHVEDGDCSKSEFASCKFDDVHFRSVDFGEADFEGSFLSKCSLLNCNFSDSNLTDLNLNQCDIIDCKFINVRMKGVKT